MDGEFTFRFEGRAYKALPGDTLAAALVRCGVFAIGRSLKHERHRGLRWLDRRSEIAIGLSDGRGQCDPGHLLLTPDMECWRVGWKERNPTGDGLEASADLAIVGAGPSGLIAALSAVRSGIDVKVVERRGEIGGGLLRTGEAFAPEWLAGIVDELAGHGVDVMLNTRIDQIARASLKGETTREGTRDALRVSFKQALFATGALERMIAFPGNDLPGVMLSETLADLARYQCTLAGKRIALFAGNDAAYRNLALAENAGAQVVAIVDARAGQRVESDWPMFTGITGLRAEGGTELHGIVVDASDGAQQIDCDILAVSGGWAPAIAPLAQGGLSAAWNPTINAWLVDPSSAPNISVAGAAGGSFTTRAAMKSGAFRARRAITALGRAPVAPPLPEADDRNPRQSDIWLAEVDGPAYVDFTADARLADVATSPAPIDREAAARRILSNPRSR